MRFIVPCVSCASQSSALHHRAESIYLRMLLINPIAFRDHCVYLLIRCRIYSLSNVCCTPVSARYSHSDLHSFQHSRPLLPGFSIPDLITLPSHTPSDDVTPPPWSSLPLWACETRLSQLQLRYDYVSRFRSSFGMSIDLDAVRSMLMHMQSCTGHLAA